MGYLIDGLKEKGIECVESLARVEDSAENTLALFRSRGFFEVSTEDKEIGETVYQINEQKRANLDFYRNSLINYLWPEFLSAALLLNGMTAGHERSLFLRGDFKFLKDLLSKELIWNPLVDDDKVLENSLGFFRKMGWLNDPAPEPADLVNRQALECFRGAIFDLVGKYYLALATAEGVGETGISQKEFAKRMAKTAMEHFPEDRARPAPTLGSVPITNALARFTEMGILEYKPGRKELTHVIDRDRMDECKRFLGGILDLKA